MQASPTEYGRWKRESQEYKIQDKKLIHQSRKILSLKIPGTKHAGILGYLEKNLT